MPAVWINEFHYDNSSTDTGEYIEIAGAAGTDLTGWTLVLYNGSNSQTYHTRTLSGVIADQQNGFGTSSFAYPVNGIQNGSPDGIALVDPDGNVVEFISYEGTITAVNGPAAGMTSVDVGVQENGSANGTAIGRTGTGDEASDFSWSLIADDTPGDVNLGQSFEGAAGPQAGILSIGDVSLAEGDAGATAFSFEVTRSSGDEGAVSVTWTIAFGSADAADLAPGQVLTGTVDFADGQTSATITVSIAGDTDFEADETFTVVLSSPTGGASLGDASATGTILNDEAPPPSTGGTPFINEIHYDNAGGDVGEAIEIAASAGTDLAGWQLVLYSVSSGATQGTVYSTRTLSGIVPDQDDGYGTLSFAYPTNGVQNGPQDGIALVDPDGNVVQFLSYEGSFTAANGPAAGLTSTDIGVSEGSDGAGSSVRLTGAGATYEDFAWASAAPDSFGAVNQGQDFIGPDATGLVGIADAAVAEGDSGSTQLVFTVRRAGGLGAAASVEWTLAIGSADSADLAPGQPLAGQVDFAVGVSSVQIVVEIAGDTVGEGNEAFEILLANPVGNIAIVDGAATGTILNDDPIALAIYEIQGEGHQSAYVGQPVTTVGIVTAVSTNGFYLQDAGGDGNARTSDAIFVFTGGLPTVAVGDAAEVTGTIGEFLPGGDPTNLTVTQLAADAVTVQSSGNALPAAVLIGAGGLLPPSETIEDDGFASYDPETDGIDFYESLEGMRVTVDSPLVVSQTTAFGETWVVASGGAGATGVNDRGGITISDGDYNPERIQIDATSALFAGYDPDHSQGDRLSDVTGVMSYSFNAYELLVTEAVTVVEEVTVGRETTSLVGGRDHLTVASYNVENLGPDDPAEKFDLLAADIVYSLAAPDIIGLQEMQDGNGLDGSDPLSAVVTAQMLIEAIAAIGGPNYVYVEVAPSTPNSTGGQPGGNIRNGFLYNADRVTYVDGSAQLITDPAFGTIRKPLIADFQFNGETVRLVNVHLTARLGSDPLWGADQPPADAGDGARTAQAEAVRAYVNDALATDPSLKLGVLGDFNGFWFEDAVGALEAGGVMTDLHNLLPEEERYSYLFDGNLQAIDHLVVTGGLAFGAEFDVVHINAEQTFETPRGSDHDPILGRFYIEAPNEAPVGVDDAVAVDEDATSDNLWTLLLGNDGDPDPEDALTIVAVDASGMLGSLIFDSAGQSLRYVADNDLFDALAPGETAVDSFSYTLADPDGLTSTATVTVTVTGLDDGVSIDAGNGNDVVTGTGGEDALAGGNGNDLLSGLAGHDLLDGGNGNDVLLGGEGRDLLRGGRGNDELSGGAEADLFVIGKGGGNDIVADYEAGLDLLYLADGVTMKSAKAKDVDGDGLLDLVVSFGNGGGSLTLLGIDHLDAVRFAGPDDLATYPAF